MRRVSAAVAGLAAAGLCWTLCACGSSSFAPSEPSERAQAPAHEAARPSEVVEAPPPPSATSNAAPSVPVAAQEPAPAASAPRAVDAPAPRPPDRPRETNDEPRPAPASARPDDLELLRVARGEGEVPLWIPRDEQLVYEVHINLGWLGSPSVGKVTMSSQVQSFITETGKDGLLEQVLLKGRAEGSYQVYTLDNTISTAILPQDWPRIVHRNVQTGTENRSRETLVGVLSGKPGSRYRGDGHCKGCKEKAHFVSGSWPWSDDAHCKKCRAAEHRVWREPKQREVPAGTLDMLSAVFLARSMVIDGAARVEFPLVDRTDLWRVQLSRGETRRIETSAGTFDAVEIQLATGAKEVVGESETTKFEGLFGIRGKIVIWMEARTGVPVRIEGAVPAGPIDIDVTIELRSARGSPRGFVSAK